MDRKISIGKLEEKMKQDLASVHGTGRQPDGTIDYGKSFNRVYAIDSGMLKLMRAIEQHENGTDPCESKEQKIHEAVELLIENTRLTHGLECLEEALRWSADKIREIDDRRDVHKKPNFVDLHDDLIGRLRDLRDELNAMVEDILDARGEADCSD